MTQEVKGHVRFIMYVAPGTNTTTDAYVGQEEVQLFDEVGTRFHTIHGMHTDEQIAEAFNKKGITSWAKSNLTVER